MKPFARFPRVARITIWTFAGLVAAIVVLFFWGSRFHGIFPLTPSQRKALRASIENTQRIELHRRGGSKAIFVITNAADIQRLGNAMNPGWQRFECLCISMADTWFIDAEGHTNIANITDHGIKFGGPWADHVSFRMYQAVPPKPLLNLMSKYDRALGASAQPTPAPNAAPPHR